jgi:hypothetical protein
MSSVIRVNPESVVAYSRQAQDQFDAISKELQSLINSVCRVRYFGAHAFAFKGAIGQMSVDFANSFSADMRAMTDHIQAVTSNISQSLGGFKLSLSYQSKPIALPDIQRTDFVDVDTTELEGLTGIVRNHFARLVDSLDQHVRCLEGTDWVGNAKESVMGAARQYTQKLKASCDEVNGKISKAIADQVATARQADQG